MPNDFLWADFFESSKNNKKLTAKCSHPVFSPKHQTKLSLLTTDGPHLIGWQKLLAACCKQLQLLDGLQKMDQLDLWGFAFKVGRISFRLGHCHPVFVASNDAALVLELVL